MIYTKVVEKVITLEDKNSHLIVVPFGDIHLGADGCNKTYLKNTIEWIRTTPNCHAIGMGDYLDAIVVGDRRFDIKSIDKEFLPDIDNLPMAQLNYLEKLIRPIKDKILCMIPGNHEDKFRQIHSVDVMHELNRDLGIETSDYMTFLRLKFNRKQFHTSPITFFLFHGAFCGRKMGGKVNNIQDLANNYNASVYCVGHSHDLFTITSEQLSLPPNGKTVLKEKRIFINTGTFLETVSTGGSGYAERKAYPIAKVGTSRIDIYPNKRPRPDIHARI